MAAARCCASRLVLLPLLCGLSACRGGAEHTVSTAASTAALPGTLTAPVDPARDDGQWTMAAKDHASLRFSGLNEINTSSVSRLRVAWTFSTGVLAGHEGAPLVVGSTMFLVTPFPNLVYAIDLAQPGGAVRWQYDPKPVAAARGVACCDVVNRGAAYWNGLVIVNTLDGRTIA